MMTPSEQCKAAGLKSLAELAEMVHKPPQTLRNWHRDSPELFAIVVAGAAASKGANADVTGLDTALHKVNIHTIRAVFDATFDALVKPHNK